MNAAHKTMRRLGDLAGSYIDLLDARAAGEVHYTPSGFRDLDDTLGGWLHEGHLIVLAARPAMGKSALAQQISESVAGQGKSVIMLSLEMSGYELTERSISRRSGVPVPVLKTGDLAEDQWPRITNALAQISDLPVLIDDASFDLTSMTAKIKAAQAALESQGLPPLGLVTVDYLQLVAGKAANRNLEIGQISGGLKRLAKELAVPVLALSQLNRAVEGRTDRRPTLSDLRESGSIEQDADLVLMLYRDDYYDEASPERGTAEVIAAKNRHGPTGVTRMAFVADRILFADLDRGWRPLPAVKAADGPDFKKDDPKPAVKPGWQPGSVT